METKNIIERRLSLETKYTLTDKRYLSIIDGGGCGCDNCGRLIANIATVKNEDGKSFNIGFDCLETFLINNKLLDGKGIEEYKHFKQYLPYYLKKAKELKEWLNINKHIEIVSIEFETDSFKRWISTYGENKLQYLTFYYVAKSGKRYNDNFKIKNGLNMDDLLEVVKSVTNKEIICI